MEKITSPTLKAILARDRQAFNTLYAAAHYRHPHIERDLFFHYLKHVLEPLTTTLEKHAAADDLTALVKHLYKRILELLGLRLLGNTTRYPRFDESFTRLIAGLPHMLTQNPEEFTAATANALLRISDISAMGCVQWTDIVLQAGRRTSDLGELLAVGKIAAWRCGLAHYRRGALQSCRNLPGDLVKIALGIDDTISFNHDALLAQLEGDPWLHPRYIYEKDLTPGLLFFRKGAFCGFGGSFVSPPQVKACGDYFMVKDSERRFVFIADIFGSTLLPVSKEEYEDGTAAGIPSRDSRAAFTLSAGGVLRCGQFSRFLPRFANFSSFASNRRTFCITSPLSHSLFFGGLARRPERDDDR